MNFVEYIVKIRDMASGQMRQIATNTDGAFSRISSRVNRVGSSVDQLNSRIDALTKTRNISLDIRQIDRATREIDSLERKRDRLENGARRGKGSMLGTGLVLGGIGLATMLGGNALKNGMDRQMAGASFEVMAGKQQGGKLHKNLIGFATDTIYGNEVFGEAKTMLGFGVAAKNIMPAMKMLGDVAMGDVEHMKSLTLAFSQSAAAGKLTGQEVLQYVNAGFNPLQAISEKTGRSMADLRKDMEKGKISFRDVAEAFQYATGPMGRFHDGMKKMGETPTGKWLAFKGAMETLSGTIGMQLLPALGGFVDLMNWLGDHQSVMFGIAIGLGLMASAWAIYSISAAWAGIVSTAAWIAVFWPIILIPVLIGLLVVVAKRWDGWGKSIMGLWGVIKAFTSIAGTGFKDFFQEVIYWGELFWLKIKNTFQFVGGMINNVINALRLALSGDFLGAGKALTLQIKTDASGEIDKLKKTRADQRTANMLSVDENKRLAAKSWAQVGLTKNKEGKKSGSATDWLNSKFDFKGQAGAGAPGGVADTAKGIAGGGVRNQTINIAKQGIDQITINTAHLREGMPELKEMFLEMFNQVINSGNAAVNPN